MKKRLITALLILLPALAAPWLLAQDEVDADEAVEQAAEETNTDSDETVDTTEDEGPAESSAEAEADDDFVPSTQISEDLSVSFPVDI